MSPGMATFHAWRRRPVARIVALVLSLLLIMDLLGWPGLAGPISRVLSGALNREVTVAPHGSRFHFLGGIRVETAQFRIAASKWSGDPYFLDGQDIRLRLGYLDLWRAWRGAPLNVKLLEAGWFDLRARRQADGRGSWPLGDGATKKKSDKRGLPVFGQLLIKNAYVSYADAILDLTTEIHLRTREGNTVKAREQSGPKHLVINFTGKYRGNPLAGRLVSSGIFNLLKDGESAPLSAYGELGGMLASFSGNVYDVTSMRALQGDFMISGPSLGEIGDLLGVTLPATGRFQVLGEVSRKDQRWKILARQAEIGRSLLSGNFEYAASSPRPHLLGKLNGHHVFLADLAPTIGAGKADHATAATGKVLPDKPFDIPSLNRMDANVRVEVEELNLGDVFARPIKPLQLSLSLKNSVLSLRDILASTADGTLSGEMNFDGREKVATWSGDIKWRGVALEKWLKQSRQGHAPAYIAGALAGRAQVSGQGRSTAEILGSLDGTVDLDLHKGRISHLAVEIAGIDLAQALGVAVSGDETLPVGCAIARFQAEHGIVHTKVAVLDTRDSTLSLNGSLSLANERLDLRLISLPKDFSFLSLRSPVNIEGTLGKPSISLDAKNLVAKLAGSALLALVNPLAAIIPLMDFGENKEAVNKGCSNVLQRARAAQSR